MEKELPKNWVETEFGNYVILKNGYAFKSTDFQNEGTPVIRISNIQDGKIDLNYSICVDESKVKKDFIINRGDILIAMSGATTGKFGVYNLDEISLQNQRVGNLKPVVEKLSNKMFTYYLLGSLKKEIEQRAYGGAQPNISPKLIESIVINLPPLAEQNRIVAKLDSLFAHLESIKTSMAKIPVLLKNFRQQVLTQAVTGKLTEISELQVKIMSDFFEVKTGSTPRKNDNRYYENGTINWIKSGEVRNSFIYKSEDFISELAIKETNAKVFPVDTILIAMYGEGKTRGQVGWMKIEAATNQAIAALVNNNLPIETKKYIYLYCLSQYNEIRLQAEGGNQPNLNLSKIKNWKISIPKSLSEQQEIVSRVESLFAKADAIEEKYKNLKTKIETLPQTILHKAFKGELTEQLDSDGHAKVLLKEIVALKNGEKPKKVVSKKYTQPDDEVLRLVAEESPSYPILSPRDKKVQRKMLAVHIVNQSLEDQSFGKTKFEKLLHLVECHVLKRDLNQNYSVQAAGPYDGGFTKTFWDDVLKSKWFAIKEQGSLKRIVGGENQNKSLKEYGHFSDEEKQKINDFIAIFENTNYERPEIVSTLYAVWNNRIKRNEPITDDLLKKDFLNWDPGKAKYKDRLDKALVWMRENGVVPNGWGKEIKKVKK